MQDVQLNQVRKPLFKMSTVVDMSLDMKNFDWSCHTALSPNFLHCVFQVGISGFFAVRICMQAQAEYSFGF